MAKIKSCHKRRIFKKITKKQQSNLDSFLRKNKIIYNQWLQIRHHNDVCSQWRTSLEIFTKDVIKSRKKSCDLIKFDASKKLGPNNFRWVNISEKARRLGITKASMRQRINKCIEKNVSLSQAFKTPIGERLPCCNLIISSRFLDMRKQIADGHCYLYKLVDLSCQFGANLFDLSNWYQSNGYRFESQKISKDEILLKVSKNGRIN